MAVAQGDGGNAIEHKANSGQACQRGPEPLLPLRQDFKVGGLGGSSGGVITAITNPEVAPRQRWNGA